MSLFEELSPEEIEEILNVSFTFIAPKKMSPEDESRLRFLADKGNEEIRLLLAHIYWMREEESKQFNKRFFDEQNKHE